MSVVNLTRYENLLIGDLTDEREMTECATGSYVKFEEAMEASSNSLQQLKAEIAAIATEFDNLGPGSCGGEHLKSFYDLVIKLRQLSAV